MKYRLFWTLVLCVYHGAVGAEAYQWHLPSWLSPPHVPADNPMTQEKVKLGNRLFYDANLSGVGYVSCATCHQIERSFAEDRPVSVGISGEFHRLNALAIVNAAYMTTLTWADPNQIRFETQATVPLFGHSPVEMGAKNHEERILLFLKRDPIYPQLFDEAFPEHDEINFDLVLKAIASFERTLISYRSAYDKYMYGHQGDALNEDAKQGMALFFSERLGCSSCHSGVHFSDATEKPSFHNTGLYNVDGQGAYPEGNQGLYEVTHDAKDKGRFRTPTLRNVALTPPYMHDGSIETLEDVIDHYAAGGRAAIKGKASPLRSDKLHPFTLSVEEKRYLIAFLNSLTDREYIENAAFQTPFR